MRTGIRSTGTRASAADAAACARRSCAWTRRACRVWSARSTEVSLGKGGRGVYVVERLAGALVVGEVEGEEIEEGEERTPGTSRTVVEDLTSPDPGVEDFQLGVFVAEEGGVAVSRVHISERDLTGIVDVRELIPSSLQLLDILCSSAPKPDLWVTEINSCRSGRLEYNGIACAREGAGSTITSRIDRSKNLTPSSAPFAFFASTSIPDAIFDSVTFESFSPDLFFQRLTFPFTHCTNHIACIPNANANIAAGIKLPPSSSTRLLSLRYAARMNKWRTMRVLKNESPKRRSERSLGCKVPRARMNVGSCLFEKCQTRDIHTIVERCISLERTSMIEQNAKICAQERRSASSLTNMYSE